jgi:hypothetical protein
MDGKVVARCLGRCTLSAPAGKYWLGVSGGASSGVHASRTRLSLADDAWLDVSVPSETARSAGLFLGIGGPILLVASFVLGQRQGTTAVPLIGAGLGGVLTASGWYVFAANSSPDVQLTPLRQRGALLGIGSAF